MRILLVSFYFPPDIGPGSLRAASIVKSLIDTVGPNLTIDVITTSPNRYGHIESQSTNWERSEQVNIIRIKLPPHKGGMADQAAAFLVFAIRAAIVSRNRSWDLVIATSSRLMTAWLGTIIAKAKCAPIYLDIRDIFSDSIKIIFTRKLHKPIHWFFQRLEKWTFSNATKINIVSEGFLFDVSKYDSSPTVLTNGIDNEFTSVDFTKEVSTQTTVLYAGNLGDGQALHNTLLDLAIRFQKEVEFVVIGGGGKKNLFKKRLVERSVKNIRLLDPMPRRELIEYYKSADVLYLQLSPHSIFDKVLPSKIFEYAATGKPILASVGGYSRCFIDKYVEGCIACSPQNIAELERALVVLLKGPTHYERGEFCKMFKRTDIMSTFAETAVSLIKGQK